MDDTYDPYMDEALQRAKPGKYGANEGDMSRLASMASKNSSLIKPLPKATSYSSVVSDSPGHGLPVATSSTSFAPDTPEHNAIQDQFGPDNPASLAEHHEAQAALYKPQMGDVANPSDDTPSPTIAQASSKGKYGDRGAGVSDIAALVGMG